MINKYKDIKSDLNQKSAQKILRLDSILSLLGSVNNEESKLKIMEAVKKFKTLEKNEMATSESHYLEKISSMIDVSVKTLRRIKIEGSKNQGLGEGLQVISQHHPEILPKVDWHPRRLQLSV